MFDTKAQNVQQAWNNLERLLEFNKGHLNFNKYDQLFTCAFKSKASALLITVSISLFRRIPFIFQRTLVTFIQTNGIQIPIIGDLPNQIKRMETFVAASIAADIATAGNFEEYADGDLKQLMRKLLATHIEYDNYEAHQAFLTFLLIIFNLKDE